MSWDPRALQQVNRGGHGKTALVLAGGGVVGAVYEIGALLALDEVLAGQTVNDFDIVVGTSAGAIVASLLANGVTPAEMVQIMDSSHPRVRGLHGPDLFGWNGAGLARWAAHLPGTLLQAWASSLWPPDLGGLVLALSDALPPGIFSGQGVERFLRHAYQQLGGTDRFEELQRELYIIATNLNTGQRAVFRQGHRTGVGISRAVTASAALPLVYAPVRIGRHAYVDGGLRGNASLDVAIERGARLVVCINPMVPYAPEDEADDQLSANTSAFGADIAWRTLRIVTHAGLHYHIKHLSRSNPGVDILCIEPRPDDVELLTANIMRYAERHRLLKRGYQAVSADLAGRHAEVSEILARHGLPCVPLDDRWAALAEGRGARSARHPHPVRSLGGTLADLDRALDQMDDQLTAIAQEGAVYV